MSLRRCLLALSFSSAAFAQSTPVIALQNLAHTVTTLEKTVPFYRDVLGLPLNVAPGRPDPLQAVPAALDADMSRFTATQGAKFRAVTFRIPNANFGFELTEFTGVPRTPVHMGAEDPGSPAFTMIVRDIDAAVAQWKGAGGTVVSTGGAAIKRPNGEGNVFVRDVNGFLFELIQRVPQ